MPTWLRLLTLTESGVKTLRTSPARVFGEMDDLVQDQGCKIVHAWVTIGEMDVITVIDAPDEDRFKALEAALDARGIYTSVSTPAIPMGEFLKMANSSGNFGLFLEAWLGQRNLIRSQAAASAGKPGPKAGSKPRKRQAGAEERKLARAALQPAAGGVVVFPDIVPPLKVRMTSLGSDGDKGSLSARLSPGDSQRLRAVDWPVGHELALALELPDDPARITVKGKVSRVDDADGNGKEVDIGLTFTGVPKPQLVRLERFILKHKR